MDSARLGVRASPTDRLIGKGKHGLHRRRSSVRSPGRYSKAQDLSRGFRGFGSLGNDESVSRRRIASATRPAAASPCRRISASCLDDRTPCSSGRNVLVPQKGSAR
jgi:hypothetical protein